MTEIVRLTDEQIDALSPQQLDEYHAYLSASLAAWTLTPKQQYAEDLTRECFFVGYGGAAGGGKSDWGLWHVYHLAKAIPRVRCLVLRTSFPELRRSLIGRSMEKFDPAVCKYRAADKEWHFTNGSVIEFGYLDKDEDVYQYKCLTPDHDVLTRQGWKPVAEVTADDEVYSTTIIGNTGSWQPVDETFTYEYNGDLQDVYGRRGVSYTCTPNHTVWAGTVKHPELRPYRADELPSDVDVPTGAILDAGEPPEDQSFCSDGNNGRTVEFGSPEWAEFLGWYITEGCTYHGRWAVRISQTKPEGRAKLEDLFSRLDINVWVGPREFSFSSKALCLWLDEHCGRGARNKRLPAEVFEWDLKHRDLLLGALIAGDGQQVTSTKATFCTMSAVLADDVGRLAITCGYKVTYVPRQGNGAHHLSILAAPRTKIRTHRRSVIPYKGPVHCLTTRPYHNFLIRHRGRVSFTGNSAEYDCIFIDEATELAEFGWRYLQSRIRITAARKRLGSWPHMILCTNPGGKGHAWFKENFVEATNHGEKQAEIKFRDPLSGVALTGPDGQPIVRKVGFVPAYVWDNPHMPEEYRLNLLSLTEVEMRQLLYGDWDVFAGQFFTDWRRPMHVVRPFNIPPEWPRVRGLDYGYRNPYCCLWGAVDWDSNLYVYRETYKPGLTAAQQAREVVSLSKMLDGDAVVPEKFLWSIADPAVFRKEGSGQTVAEQWKTAGLATRPAKNDRISGWSSVRELLRAREGLEFDPELLDEVPRARLRVFPVCENLIRTIPNQVFDDVNIEDMLKNDDDHACFPAGTIVECERGGVPIEQVTASDRVLTRDGFFPVRGVGMTGTRSVTTVDHSLGWLTATPEHPVWVQDRGWTRIDSVGYGDELCWLRSSPIEASNIGAIPTPRTEPNVSITRRGLPRAARASSGYISRSTSTISGRYPKGTTSTTATRTRRTTTRRTSSRSLPKNTGRFTATKRLLHNSRTLRRFVPRPPSGTARQRGGHGTGRTGNGRGRTARFSQRHASSATPNTSLSIQVVPSSVRRPARPQPFGPVAVYNLTVDGPSEFFADGVLVHNCDTIRYIANTLVRAPVAAKRSKYRTPDQQIWDEAIELGKKGKGGHPVLGKI